MAIVKARNSGGSWEELPEFSPRTTEVIDSLESEDSLSALSANMGKTLNDTLQDLTTSTTYPVGSVIFNSNNINPKTYLNYGTWECQRVFYGGELLAFGLVTTDTGGTEQTANTYYCFSDPSFGEKKYEIVNMTSLNILEGSSGTAQVHTRGVVGFVEAEMYVSGLGSEGMKGHWWGAENNNTLPDGVYLLGTWARRPLLTGPIGSNYGGNSNTYFYNVETNSDVSFFVNPKVAPYNAGTFLPSGGGVGCQLKVKVYAKHGTNYMWKRVN